ncbi:hypothetical protein V1387_12740 [Allomuricauda taeanensis]|uniref:DUF6712 family protein n=1 Tax=Flagellimonas taeanensis TaxID=1005926 RepID=UPI002E7B0063|nr:hypothetical protein [Allomuricauda taeanensis]MEE1963557.1 hypothetical protein [Allomuricauda taeanensis]
MSNLITVEEFNLYEKLPFDNRADIIKKIEKAIEGGQMDFQKVAGNNLYFDIHANRNAPEFTYLMVGSNFIVDNIQYTHPGVKRVVSKFAYSRYVYDINTNHTAFGMQERIGENSQAVHYAKLKEISRQAQVDANDMWELVELYLKYLPEDTETKNITTRPQHKDAVFGNFKYRIL